MVTRALDYIGDIMKHIKPSLVSKNPEALQLVYWAVGRCRACSNFKHTETGASGAATMLVTDRNIIVRVSVLLVLSCFRLHSKALEPPAGHI